MQAQTGDRIIARTGSSSIGLIVGVLGDDGRPPYIVKWLRTGHIAMVTPGPYARVIPAGPRQAPASSGLRPGPGATATQPPSPQRRPHAARCR
jgi:hypothetical protein